MCDAVMCVGKVRTFRRYLLPPSSSSNLNMYATCTFHTLMTAGTYDINTPCLPPAEICVYALGLPDVAICYKPSILAYLCLCLFEWLSTLKLYAGVSLCSDRIRAGQP